MNQILDPLLLRDTATKGSIAVTYLLVGLGVGVLFFNRQG